MVRISAEWLMCWLSVVLKIACGVFKLGCRFPPRHRRSSRSDDSPGHCALNIKMGQAAWADPSNFPLLGRRPNVPHHIKHTRRTRRRGIHRVGCLPTGRRILRHGPGCDADSSHSVLNEELRRRRVRSLTLRCGCSRSGARTRIGFVSILHDSATEAGRASAVQAQPKASKVSGNGVYQDFDTRNINVEKVNNPLNN